MKERPHAPPLTPVPSDPAQLWQELVAQARDKPWLLRLLDERGAAFYLRFRTAYQRLLRLRSGQLRGLQRKLGVGLAGAALLLALSSSSGLAAPDNNGIAPTASITVDGTICTLAVAIDNANSGGDTDGAGGCDAGSAGADTLTLINDINLTSALPEIASDITIEGGIHTITGDNTFGILYVNSGAGLTLNETTISGGSATFGGGIYNEGALTVQNSTLSGNSATKGGGIYNIDTLTVQDSTISNSSATRGGGIWTNGTMMVQDSTISGNSISEVGAGIYSRGALTVQDSTLSGNSAGSFGGGIYSTWDSTVTVQNSTLSGNSASIGGGIINYYGTVVVENSTLSDNSASSGGGIWNVGALTVENSTLSGNSASSGGGGISNNGTMTVHNSTLSNNSASDGGGIKTYNTWGNTVTVQNITLSGNLATKGGGIWNNDTVIVQDSTLSGNSASDGGGIYNMGGTVTVENSTLSNNSAWYGGGIFNYDNSTVTAQNSIVANQSAGDDCDNHGTVISYGYNIESGTSCGFTIGSDQQNTDPLLGPLADKGGPTETHALLPGSTAIDVAPTASCSGNDQRGVPRNQDGNGIASSDECDIGAVEAIALSASLINDGADVEFTWAGAGLDGYQLWRSEIPYDSYALFQDNLTGPSFSTPVDTTTNYYYELRGLVSGETVYISRRIGVFSFALVPGAP